MSCCRVGKDPRFEALSGAFNPDRFRKQYGFVFDEQLPAERSSLKAAMKVGVWTPSGRGRIEPQCGPSSAGLRIAASVGSGRFFRYEVALTSVASTSKLWIGGAGGEGSPHVMLSLML